MTGWYGARRVPVSIFVGSLSEEDSLDLARHAQKTGADMLLTISPYCRRPTQEEIFRSIVRIGTHTDLPVLTYNSPWRNGEGVEFTSDLVARLIANLLPPLDRASRCSPLEQFGRRNRSREAPRPFATFRHTDDGAHALRSALVR